VFVKTPGTYPGIVSPLGSVDEIDGTPPALVTSTPLVPAAVAVGHAPAPPPTMIPFAANKAEDATVPVAV
jgi:hypothetical protein